MKLQEGRGARLLRLWGSSFFIPSCRSRNACRSSGLQVQLFYLRFRDHCGFSCLCVLFGLSQSLGS